jgi:hypothetical protein
MDRFEVDGFDPKLLDRGVKGGLICVGDKHLGSSLDEKLDERRADFPDALHYKATTG